MSSGVGSVCVVGGRLIMMGKTLRYVKEHLLSSTFFISLSCCIELYILKCLFEIYFHIKSSKKKRPKFFGVGTGQDTCWLNGAHEQPVTALP